MDQLNKSRKPLPAAAQLRRIALWVSPILVVPLLQYLAVCPVQTDGFAKVFLFFQWTNIVWFFVLLAACLTQIAAPFLLLVRRLRPRALRSLLPAAVVAAAVIVGVGLSVEIRTSAFERLAAGSESLVQAIRAYQARQGTPPADLQALVPEFLPGIPGTGVAAYPRYQYYAGAEAAQYDGNPWVLVVHTPIGGINFDRFLYYPLQNYPEDDPDGWFERLGDWAYFHE